MDIYFINEKYIVKHNGKNAIVVNKEDKFVARDPDEQYFHGIDGNGKHLNLSIPYDDRERYDIIYLDDIDKGEPFVTENDKFRDEYVKKEKYIIKKILLVKTEIYNSVDVFYNVRKSKKLDEVYENMKNKVRKNEIEYLKENWGIEQLLNSIEKDDFDFGCLEGIPDDFYKILQEILLNKEKYYYDLNNSESFEKKIRESFI